MTLHLKAEGPADIHICAYTILRFPGAWRSLVASYHLTSTDADDELLRKRGVGSCISVSPRAWSCKFCPGKSFRSERALLSHMRAAHGCRNQLRRFIGPSASCPVCCMQFANRPKALAHLQDCRKRAHQAALAVISFSAACFRHSLMTWFINLTLWTDSSAGRHSSAAGHSPARLLEPAARQFAEYRQDHQRTTSPASAYEERRIP